MSKKCSFNACCNIVEHAISCSDSSNFFCNEHLRAYIPTSSDYRIIELLKNIEEDDKLNLLYMIRQNLLQFKQAKKKLSKTISSLFEIINHHASLASSYINENENNLYRMEKSIMLLNKIDPQDRDFISKSPIIIPDVISFLKFENEVCNIFENNFNVKVEPDASENIIFSACEKIYNFDLRTKQKSLLCKNDKIDVDWRGICTLPNGYFFINTFNYCHVYNFKTEKCKKVKDLKYNGNVTSKDIDGWRVPIYYEEYVYLLGGAAYQNERFCVDDRAWDNVENSPLLSNNTIFGNVMNGVICLGGASDQYIYSFNTNGQHFLQTFYLGPSHTAQFMGFGFIFTQEGYYEISKNDYMEVIKKPYSRDVKFTKSYHNIFIRNGYIYSFVNGFKIFRFNIRNSCVDLFTY
ncbi:hypothetical protein SteCoe_13283 [Stentor coeruleus]|uniref:Uncharacterized protein n=1 Tax=Stentor coeruleus TaxID=5963 RepID=A0A1R2C8Z6_9CILI|nr:hypothetical protein SteCoe_13283 [Stentor coeruleus]